MGCEAPTVTDDLERATRVNRSGPYHAFRSKRGLFDVAVADHLDAVARPGLRVLLSGSCDASGLSAYFDGLAVETSRRGCLLVEGAAAGRVYRARPSSSVSTAVPIRRLRVSSVLARLTRATCHVLLACNTPSKVRRAAGSA